MAIEVRGVIAARQGLSCAGYLALAERTEHLRSGLYVTVTDGVRTFRPEWGFEHFPTYALECHYLGNLRLGFNESVGAGGGEVLFALEGPFSEQGAEIITRELRQLDPVLNQGAYARFGYAQPFKQRYLAKLNRERFAVMAGLGRAWAPPAAYRPPHMDRAHFSTEARAR